MDILWNHTMSHVMGQVMHARGQVCPLWFPVVFAIVRNWHVAWVLM